MTSRGILSSGLVAVWLISLACATTSRPPGMADPYRGLRGKYPELYNLVGIGEAKLTGNAQRDRQGAEILAKAEIARQIRVTVKEQILDIAREGGRGAAPTEEFTRIAESRAEEVLEGVKVVERGEDPTRGVVYAVAVLPRKEAIARLTERARLAYEQATTLIRRAEEAKQAGDAAADQRFLIEARQALLNGMALEGERTVIAGSLKDLPGTIPAISGRPDLDAIEARLPPMPPGAPAALPQAPTPGPPPPALAARPPTEPIWVTARGEAPFGEDTTLGEAKAKALDNARRNAIESVTGVKVAGSTIVYNYQLEEDLVESMGRGYIEEEQVLDEGSEDVKQPDARGRMRSFTMRYAVIRAKVLPLPERRIAFRLEAHLDQDRTNFKTGDETRINIRASDDSHLYIFNITHDGSVFLLLPNTLIPDHKVFAGTEYVFPPEKLRQQGIKLRVATPPGLKRVTEKIKVIASTEKLDVMGKFKEAISVGVFSEFKAKDTGLVNDLFKELARARVGGADLANTTLPYEVKE